MDKVEQNCLKSFSLPLGEEIFTFYGYQANPFPNDFPWYFDAMKSVEADVRRETERRLSALAKGTKIKVVGAKNRIRVVAKLEL